MSKEDLIVSLGLEDKGVAKQITELNKELKYMDKEFQNTSKSSKNFENTSEGLNKKLGYLEKSYDANKLKLEAYNKKADESRIAIAKKEAELQKLTSAENVNEKAVEKCTNQLNSMKDGLRETERNISFTESELQKLSKELANTQKKIDGIKFTELGAQLDKVGNNLKKVGDNVSSIGTKFSLALTTPILAIGTACVNAANSLTEMQRKSQVVFGNMTQDVADWAMQNERALGLGSGTIQGMATDLADLTQGLGQTKEASFKMAKGATELAVQLGNWGNVAPTDAMNDLKSALSGSHKAMEKYGVKLNDTVLSEQARAIGLGDSFSALTEAQKAEVRYQAIIKASGNAINFWNDGNRNMAFYVTEAKEQIGNLSENIGMVLLPAVTEMIKKIADVTAKIAAWSTENPELIKTIVKIAGLTALIGPLLVVFGTLMSKIGGIIIKFGLLATKIGEAGGMVSFITGLFNPLNLVIVGIIAVVAALALAWATDFCGIREKTKEILENIKSIISSVLEGIKYAWNNNLLGIQTITTTIFESIKVIFSTILDAIIKITEIFSKALKGDWEGCFKAIVNLTDTLLSGAKQVVNNILSAISNIFGVELNTMKLLTDTIFNNIKLIFSSVLSAIKGIVTAFISVLKGDWRGALDALYNAASEIWANIKQLFSTSLQALVTSVCNIGSSMYSAGRNILNSLWDGCKSIWNNLANWFTEKTRWISNIFSNFNNTKNQMASYSGPSTYSLGEQAKGLRAFSIDTTGLDNIALSGSYYNANTMQSRELIQGTNNSKNRAITDSLGGILGNLKNSENTSINASINIDNVTIKNDDDYKTMAKKLVNELNIELQKLKNTNRKVKGGKIYA